MKVFLTGLLSVIIMALGSVGHSQQLTPEEQTTLLRELIFSPRYFTNVIPPRIESYEYDNEKILGIINGTDQKALQQFERLPKGNLSADIQLKLVQMLRSAGGLFGESSDRVPWNSSGVRAITERLRNTRLTRDNAELLAHLITYTSQPEPIIEIFENQKNLDQNVKEEIWRNLGSHSEFARNAGKIYHPKTQGAQRLVNLLLSTENGPAYARAESYANEEAPVSPEEIPQLARTVSEFAKSVHTKPTPKKLELMSQLREYVKTLSKYVENDAATASKQAHEVAK